MEGETDGQTRWNQYTLQQNCVGEWLKGVFKFVAVEISEIDWVLCNSKIVENLLLALLDLGMKVITLIWAFQITGN